MNEFVFMAEKCMQIIKMEKFWKCQGNFYSELCDLKLQNKSWELLAQKSWECQD